MKRISWRELKAGRCFEAGDIRRELLFKVLMRYSRSNETTYYHDVPFSIALVTDIHNMPPKWLPDSLARNHPDIICISGDIACRHRHSELDMGLENQRNILPFLKTCVSIAPTFLSLGNHDWVLPSSDYGIIREAGVIVLDDNWTEWNSVFIGGLTSPSIHRNRIRQQIRKTAEELLNTDANIISQDGPAAGDHEPFEQRQGNPGPSGQRQDDHAPSGQRQDDHADARIRKRFGSRSSTKKPDIQTLRDALEDLGITFPEMPREPAADWLDDFERLPGYKILLSHHPEYYPSHLADRNIDLILSGHAHGGQWRFRGHGLFAPGQGWFPRLTSGAHGKLVISRGLSNTTMIPRINNPPEVVYIHGRQHQTP